MESSRSAGNRRRRSRALSDRRSADRSAAQDGNGDRVARCDIGAYELIP
jgi:hypothetical protein